MKTAVSKAVRTLLFLVGLGLCLIFFLTPVLWAIFNSFKTNDEIFSWPPTFFPHDWTLEQYTGAFEARNVPLVFSNSLIIAVLTTLFSLMIGFLAAYPMARYHTRGYRYLLSTILIGRMIPAVALAVPMHYMFTKLGLINTKPGLIICYTMFCLPFTIFLMKGFIQQIPEEIEEAAMIDGCNRSQLLGKVILPLSTVGLGTTAIFNFLLSWNDLFFAIILTQTDRVRTIPVAITMFQTDRNTDFGQLYAFMTLAMVPVLILAIFAQKYMVQGLTMGAVKG